MVGVAVVGTGFGCRVHVPALRGAGFDVLALVGVDEERTARRGEAAGGAVGTDVVRRRARAPGRRRGHDRHAARHACGARDQGVRGGQARALREAVRDRCRGGGAHGRRRSRREGRQPRRSRVSMDARACRHGARHRDWPHRRTAHVLPGAIRPARRRSGGACPGLVVRRARGAAAGSARRVRTSSTSCAPGSERSRR